MIGCVLKMLGEEFVLLIESGATPVIQFNKDILEREQYAGVGVRCRVLEVSYECDGVYLARCDLKEFESHNDSIDGREWLDSTGIGSLSWIESGFYPEDGIYDLYFDLDYEIFWNIL